MLRLHDHHVEPSLLAKFNKQRGNTGTEPSTGTVPTNFSVVRLKRDVLRRSSVGAPFTGRSVSIDQNGTNRVYGVDGDLGFYDNLRINTYLQEVKPPITAVMT